MKPVLATSERVYTPASIEEARKSLPAVGRRIRIKYQREYLGVSASNIKGGSRMVIRKAEVIQKTQEFFTVKILCEEPPTHPEQKKEFNKRGSYNQSFNYYVDLIIGRVKILGVSE